MKARVKATGAIIEVRPSEYVCDMQGEIGTLWSPRELEFDEPDYWERLKHQYAGMAMQQLVSLVNVGYDYVHEETAIIAYNFAHALVEKLKEEEKK